MIYVHFEVVKKEFERLAKALKTRNAAGHMTDTEIELELSLAQYGLCIQADPGVGNLSEHSERVLAAFARISKVPT
jgi:hypothetical protein